MGLMVHGGRGDCLPVLHGLTRAPAPVYGINRRCPSASRAGDREAVGSIAFTKPLSGELEGPPVFGDVLEIGLAIGGVADLVGDSEDPLPCSGDGGACGLVCAGGLEALGVGEVEESVAEEPAARAHGFGFCHGLL